MNKRLIKRAARLYATTYLAGIMGVFIYLSVGVLISAAAPSGRAMNVAAMTITNAVALFLQAGLYFCIVYGKQWERGDKDANAVQFGKLADDPWRGVKVGLLAAVPSFVSWLVLVADKCFGIWPHIAMVYRLCQVGLYPIVVWSMGSEVMVPSSAVGWGGIVCAGMPVLFLPVVAGLAYFFGYRHIQVWERLVFVRKKK